MAEDAMFGFERAGGIDALEQKVWIHPLQVISILQTRAPGDHFCTLTFWDSSKDPLCPWRSIRFEILGAPEEVAARWEASLKRLAGTPPPRIPA